MEAPSSWPSAHRLAQPTLGSSSSPLDCAVHNASSCGRFHSRHVPVRTSEARWERAGADVFHKRSGPHPGTVRRDGKLVANVVAIFRGGWAGTAGYMHRFWSIRAAGVISHNGHTASILFGRAARAALPTRDSPSVRSESPRPSPATWLVAGGTWRSGRHGSNAHFAHRVRSAQRSARNHLYVGRRAGRAPR